MAPKSLQELPKTANKAPWSFPRLDFWISQLDSGVLGIQNQSLEFQDWTLNFKTELDLTSRLDFQTGLSAGPTPPGQRIAKTSDPELRTRLL